MPQTQTKEYIKGIKFPFRKGKSALPQKVVDDDLLKQSITMILGITKGEREMRPDFGSRILDLLFETNTDLLAGMIREEVYTAVTRFERRVRLLNVLVTRTAEEVTIEVQYQSALTGQYGSAKVLVPVDQQ